MEKYGVSLEEVEELVKLGVDESAARELVAKGLGPKAIKEAGAPAKPTDDAEEE